MTDLESTPSTDKANGSAIGLTEKNTPMDIWVRQVIGNIKTQFSDKPINGAIAAYRDTEHQSLDFVVWADERSDFLSINITITDTFQFNHSEPCAPTVFDALDMISLITTPLNIKCEITNQYN